MACVCLSVGHPHLAASSFVAEAETYQKYANSGNYRDKRRYVDLPIHFDAHPSLRIKLFLIRVFSWTSSSFLH